MNFLSGLFNSKQEKERKAYLDGFRYVQEQLLLFGSDSIEMERLEAESLGWEDNHPFDKGMRDALSQYEKEKEK